MTTLIRRAARPRAPLRALHASIRDDGDDQFAFYGALLETLRPVTRGDVQRASWGVHRARVDLSRERGRLHVHALRTTRSSVVT